VFYPAPVPREPTTLLHTGNKAQLGAAPSVFTYPPPTRLQRGTTASSTLTPTAGPARPLRNSPQTPRCRAICTLGKKKKRNKTPKTNPPNTQQKFSAGGHDSKGFIPRPAERFWRSAAAGLAVPRSVPRSVGAGGAARGDVSARGSRGRRRRRRQSSVVH